MQGHSSHRHGEAAGLGEEEEPEERGVALDRVWRGAEPAQSTQGEIRGRGKRPCRQSAAAPQLCGLGQGTVPLWSQFPPPQSSWVLTLILDSKSSFCFFSPSCGAGSGLGTWVPPALLGLSPTALPVGSRLNCEATRWPAAHRRQEEVTKCPLGMA